MLFYNLIDCHCCVNIYIALQLLKQIFLYCPELFRYKNFISTNISCCLLHRYINPFKQSTDLSSHTLPVISTPVVGSSSSCISPRAREVSAPARLPPGHHPGNYKPPYDRLNFSESIAIDSPISFSPLKRARPSSSASSLSHRVIAYLFFLPARDSARPPTPCRAIRNARSRCI